MEELNIIDLFKYLGSKVALVLLILLITIGGGISYTLLLKKPMYNSSTTLVLAQIKDNSNSEITQNEVLLNQKLVSTYREIIKSRKILDQVIEKLNLDMSESKLSKLIDVNSIKDTEIIKITVNNQDNETASKIANTIADVFAKEIVDIYNIQNVKVIDKADLNEKPYNISVVKESIVYTLGGLVLSLLIVFTMFYFDTSVKTTEEVEQKLGLPILGSVPNHGKRKGKK